MKRKDVEIGLKVKIVRKCADYSNGWNNNWEEEMDRYVNNGEEYTVDFISIDGIAFKEDSGRWRFPWESLEPVEDKIPKFVMAKETNRGNFIIQGKIYEVISEDLDSYQIRTSRGIVGMVYKHRFTKLKTAKYIKEYIDYGRVELNKFYPVIKEEKHRVNILNDGGEEFFYEKGYFKIFGETKTENKKEPEMKYKKLKNFTAEDLRKLGACNEGIEEFIKHFGFTKDVPLTEDSICIMEGITDCIPFLLRNRFIEKGKEEIFYRVGDRFMGPSGESILCSPQVHMASLINLTTGARWTEMVHVNNSQEITEEEFGKIIGSGHFTKIN